MKILSFLLLLSGINLSLTELTYNEDATCSVTTVYNRYILDESTVTYFRSPNFPLTMYNSTLIEQNALFCNARFTTISKLWFVIYNGNIGAFKVWNNYTENKTMSQFDENSYFVFSPSHNSLMFNFASSHFYFPWTAFEGIVHAASPLNICPFSEEIIKFENDRVIPIASTYDLENSIEGLNCKWTFSMNPNQTLKIVFKFLNISGSTGLQLETDGNIVEIFNSSILQPQVYYVESISGNFTLSYSSSSATIYTKFFALVSVVDKSPNNTKQICPQNTTGIMTTITNMNYEHGYFAFDTCSTQILIPENNAILLNIYALKVEKGADKLILYNGLSEIFFELDKSEWYYLSSDANGTTLDFSADGNTQQAGFTVYQRNLNCTCTTSNVVIPCNNSVNIAAISDTYFYCQNMACNFTISLEPSCAANYFTLDFFFKLDNIDSMILYENGVKIDNFTSNATISGLRVFSTESNVSLQFTSGPAGAAITPIGLPKEWEITAKMLSSNIYPTFQLTDSIPYFVLQSNNMNTDDVFVICASDNDTLELFVPENRNRLWKENLLLFDSNKMENFVGSLDSPLISTTNDTYPRHIASSSGCFTLYNGIESPDMFLFFRMQNAHSKNCENTNNVFSIKDDYGTVINATASNGPCDITLLAAAKEGLPAIQFDYLYSSLSNDTFEISSAINQKTFFTINSTDFDFETTIYSPALTLSISSNESIFMLPFAPAEPEKIYLSDNVKRGFLASPEYGGYSLEKYRNTEILLYNLRGFYQTYNIELDVGYMNGSGTVIFTNGNTNITLQSDETYSLNGTNFLLIYHPSNELEFLIEYTVTPLISTTTTRTPPTTTTPQVQPTNVTLTSNNQYYVFWLDNLALNQYITVCTQNDDILELFVTAGYELYSYDLYDYNGFYNHIGTLSSNNITTTDIKYPKSIISKSNCFTILRTYASSKTYGTVLFRRRNQRARNCVNDNIIQAPISSANITLKNLSVGKNCEMIILGSMVELPIIRIGSITSALESGDWEADDNYVFTSAINKMPLMNFNSTDAKNWRNVAIYTYALSITFKRQIRVELLKSDTTIEKDDKISQRGIIVSPSYCGFSSKLTSLFPMYEFINSAVSTNKIAANFVVKSMDKGLTIAVNNFDDGHKNHTLSSNEKYMTIGNHIDIFYEETTTPNSGVLIEYTLTSVSKFAVINLTTTSPTYVFWLDNLKPLDMLTVCSPKTDTLQMFVTQGVNSYVMDQYLLYNSDRLDSLIGTLNSTKFESSSTSNTPKQIVSSSGCFTIFNQGNSAITYRTLFFRMSNEQSKNCYPNNVFEVQANATTLDSLYATSNGPCEVIILSSQSQNPVVPVYSFETYSLSATYTVRSGINQKPLITIDKNNVNAWKNFKLFTPALSILIPSSQTLTVKLDSYNNNYYQVSNGTPGQKGIIASPAYNGFGKPYSRTSMFTFFSSKCQTQSGKCGINLKVNSCDYGSVKYRSDGSDHILQQNDDVTSFASTVYVDYAQNNSNSSFLITYTILDSSANSISIITTLLMGIFVTILIQ